jgi:[ribosomal protein S18]-alanine N-acetyltransferase
VDYSRVGACVGRCGGGYSAAMTYAVPFAIASALPRPPSPLLRHGERADLDALLKLEQDAFATDRMSRRSFRHFMASPSAALIVAEHDGQLAGYALVLFRPPSAVSRLYSIAVTKAHAGQGVGNKLLAAGEAAALRRGCAVMRLEVHEANAPAINRYRRSGYCMFGRRLDYYQDHGVALRFEKRLAASSTAGKDSSSPAASVAR